MLLFLRDADVVDQWLKNQHSMLSSKTETSLEMDLEKANVKNTQKCALFHH